MNKFPIPPFEGRVARELWEQITAEHDITDTAKLLILRLALEAFCRMRRAQKALGEEGGVTETHMGAQKVHPLVTVERDCRTAMFQAFRLLGADLGLNPIQPFLPEPKGSGQGTGRSAGPLKDGGSADE